jgi:hypothetical protein
VPTDAGLEEHVFRSFNRMYEAFARDRPLLGPGQFVEVRYEELIADPIRQMQRVYEELDLNEFESARPGIEAYLGDQKDYKPNRFRMAPDVQAALAQHWGRFLDEYHYTKPDSQP